MNLKPCLIDPRQNIERLRRFISCQKTGIEKFFLFLELVPEQDMRPRLVEGAGLLNFCHQLAEAFIVGRNKSAVVNQ